MPAICRIAVYPLKSFDANLLNEARVLSSGALQHDRRFGLVDSDGRFFNAKRTASVHDLRVLIDLQSRVLSLKKRSDGMTFDWHMDGQRTDLEAWFSEYFARAVSLVEDDAVGFPDDLEAPGPTIVSTASLQAVVNWFPGVTLDEVRRRFRANLEIEGVEPFWEDRLFNGLNQGDRPFRIGDVTLGGSNPCQRCVVPTRNPDTGAVWPEFARQFAELRAANLPPWAAQNRFNHFYRLTVNTRLIDPGPGIIRVGDEVELVD